MPHPQNKLISKGHILLVHMHCCVSFVKDVKRTYLLPVPDCQEDDLKRLRLEHDVLHDVVGQAVDVQVGQTTFVELSLNIRN